MEEAIVRVEHLSHRYSVDWAIRDINLEVKSKGVFGLLGSNGAGKSTTMNIICGVLNQTEGNVWINNINLRENPVEAKKFIGFLPQRPPLYPDMTVEEYLTYCANLRLMEPMEIGKAVERAMARCGVTHFRSRLLRNLSGGYQQRIGIAQAIVHHPQFVVLDEPTNGLDPNQILEIRSLNREIAEYHSVLLSTHILPEVQAICREIKMIEHGELVFSGTMEQFDNYIEPASFVVEFGDMPDPEALLAIAPVAGLERLDEHRMRIRFRKDLKVTREYIRQSVLRDWDLREISTERSSLHEIFAQLSGRKNADQMSDISENSHNTNEIQ